MYGNMQPELAACNLDLDAIWHKKGPQEAVLI